MFEAVFADHQVKQAVTKGQSVGVSDYRGLACRNSPEVEINVLVA